MTRVLLLALPVWLLFTSFSIAEAFEADKPNIVYVMLDEWGYHEWSGGGHPIHQTPNFDRMADEGMRFTQMLAGSCVCAPTRCTLMTGMHTGHSTVRANGGSSPLRTDDVTIAKLLKDSGYAVGGFGKWGIGDRGTTGVPENHGFDEFFGYYHQVHAHTYFPKYLIRNSTPVPLTGNTGHAFKGETWSQELIHSEAKKFITKHAGKQPFFAYLPYTLPHAYYGIPEDDPAYVKYKSKDWNAPQHHKSPNVAPANEAQRYAAFVEIADRQFGEILNLLKSLGVDDNTIVFLCGDNGANTNVFLDKEHPNGFFAPNVDPKTKTVFRAGKGSLYEGGLRVPYMVRWPGRIQAGTVSKHLGYFPDAMPTLADIAGVKVPPNIDGISFAPTLLGKDDQQQHDHLYWEYKDQIALRRGDWKAVRPPKSKSFELYNLSTDVSESNNLADQHPDTLKQLTALAMSERQPIERGKVLDPTVRFRGHQADPVGATKPRPAQQTALRVAGMFGDEMVFQRETNAAIWGRTNPNVTVSVTPSWSNETYRTKAGPDGKWQTKIQTPKAGGPFQVTVSNGPETVTLNDVLVGEVWICSGQSNMQWKMRGFGVDHFKDDVVKANYSRIRFCDVPQVIALRGKDEVQAKWTTCSPRTVLGFSAVGYFFGSRLHEELDIPIGLISTNWGGSSAEAWVSPEILRKDFPEFNQQFAINAKTADKLGETFPRGKKPPKGLNQRNPSVLYNSMIRPLIPFSFRGVVWYQGESNVKQPKQYRTLFPAMIRDWRTRWSAGNFPFYFVQIAPFAYKPEPISAAFLREAQLMALSEPNTSMVVTMDIGNPTNIHPKQKKPVGERLAWLALKRDYGRANIVDSGPMLDRHEVEGTTIRLHFKDIGSGLITQDQKAPSHFTIAGEDQKFVEATAVIDGNTIVVSSTSVPHPVAVRYAWGSGDMPNVSNKEGLPASSFRTDDWPIR